MKLVRLNNHKSGFKAFSVNGKEIRSSENSSDVNVEKGAFWSRVRGMFTDSVISDLHLASTAISPAVALKSKQAFNKIAWGAQFLSEVLAKIKLMQKALNYKASDEYKKNELKKRIIKNAFGRYTK